MSTFEFNQKLAEELMEVCKRYDRDDDCIPYHLIGVVAVMVEEQDAAEWIVQVVYDEVRQAQKERAR